MTLIPANFTAANTPTRFVDVGGRRLAYRSGGDGKPLVLCHRFRGVLDLWDPAFIDGLAARGFRVITFDYSTSRSTVSNTLTVSRRSQAFHGATEKIE
jgi:hypothetical protein